LFESFSFKVFFQIHKGLAKWYLGRNGETEMHSALVEEVVRDVLGDANVSSVTSRRAENSDGNHILWVEVNYMGMEGGPGVEHMQTIVDRLWSEPSLNEFTPVVNFNSAEEPRPLEAAE
jgi:hypothetical protein